jgi:hypothetical protein
MKEIYKFRIDKDVASLLFKPEECRNVAAHLVECKLLSTDDRFDKIWSFNKSYRLAEGVSFFNWWHGERRYSQAEFDQAEFFRCKFMPRCYFEPAGEDCGTIYDESTACPYCGVGAKQISPLRLQINSIPKSVDCAVTIAEVEHLFSNRLLAALNDSKITGLRSQKIEALSKKRANPLSVIQWEQVFSEGPLVQLSPQTITGNQPQDYDEKNEYRCTCGHWCGLKVLSELHINRNDLPKSDFAMTFCHFGRRRGKGIIRQSPAIIVSQRFKKVFDAGGFKGLQFEIVRID